MSVESKGKARSIEADLCIVLGVVLLLCGFVAYLYWEESWLLATYPYRDLAVPLLVLGVVLIIAGAFLRIYASRKT